MTCVRVVCDSNFKKTEDVDKTVLKVLKMFSEHFTKKMTPLNEDSDMECVYVYDNLTPDQVRLLKKLLNQNKTLLNFKEIVISKPGKSKSDKMSTSSGNSSKSWSTKSSGSSAKSKSTDSNSSTSKSTESKSSTGKSSTGKSSHDSSTSKPLSLKSQKNIAEIAEQLRVLAEEVEKLTI